MISDVLKMWKMVSNCVVKVVRRCGFALFTSKGWSKAHARSTECGCRVGLLCSWVLRLYAERLYVESFVVLGTLD